MNWDATEMGASLLGAMILAAIIVFFRMPSVLEMSAPYLMASICAGFYSLLTSAASRSELQKGRLNESTSSAQQSNAKILHLTAWQLAILGALNICASQFPTSRFVPVIVCSVTIISVYVSDRFVALTDRRDQIGGFKPMRFFGTLRTRRLFFWGLVFYPATTLVLAGCMLYAKDKSYPSPFQPVQLFILFVAVLSTGTAGLAFERYRGNVAKKNWGYVILIGVILVLFFSGFFCWVLGLSFYTYTLSSLTVVTVAVSANLMLRAVGGESVLASGSQAVPHNSRPSSHIP